MGFNANTMAGVVTGSGALQLAAYALFLKIKSDNSDLSLPSTNSLILHSSEGLAGAPGDGLVQKSHLGMLSICGCRGVGKENGGA